MLKEKPLVSIITVSFNSEATIEQTILSVLQQTYTNIEYIIIDGGSTDNTKNIINRYIDQIDVFVSEKDDGVYDAMNKGVAMATGILVGIINSDDWYDLSAVETIVKAYNKNPNLNVVHGGVRMYKGNSFDCEFNPPTRNITSCMLPHPSCFVTLETYKRYGVFNPKYKVAADYDLMARIYVKNGCFVHLKENLSNFRYGGISTSNHMLGHDEAESIKRKYNLVYNMNFVKRVKRIFKRVWMKAKNISFF